MKLKVKSSNNYPAPSCVCVCICTQPHPSLCVRSEDNSVELVLSSHIAVFLCFPRVSLCSLGCPGTSFVDQASIKLTEIHLPQPPELLGSKVYATTSWLLPLNCFNLLFSLFRPLSFLFCGRSRIMLDGRHLFVYYTGSPCGALPGLGLTEILLFLVPEWKLGPCVC